MKVKGTTGVTRTNPTRQQAVDALLWEAPLLHPVDAEVLPGKL